MLRVLRKNKKGVPWSSSLHRENFEGLLKKVLFNRPSMADSLIPLVVLIPYFLSVRLRPAFHRGVPGSWLTDTYATLPSFMVDTMLVCRFKNP